jgi:hypothetical protein
MLENRCVMTRFQYWVLGLLVASALFVILFPLLVYANVLSQSLFLNLLELFGEVVVIPIYAAALAVIVGSPLIKSVLVPRAPGL